MKIEDSFKWIKTIDTLLDGVSFANSERRRGAVSLFHLCIEHNKGIYACFKGDAPGSAFALIRPQFEAFIRGMWVSVCASDEQVSKFLRGGEPPRIGEMIESIEEHPDFGHKKLGEFKRRIWKIVNNFTHGGSAQVKSRNTEREIISSYKISEIQWVLRRASQLALLSAIETANMADNEPLSDKLMKEYEDIFGEP